MEKVLARIKKGLGFIVAFFAGVLTFAFGSRLRNNGKPANDDRREHTDYSGQAGRIGEEIGDIRDGLERARADIEGAREATTDTIRIIQEIRERQKIDD